MDLPQNALLAAVLMTLISLCAPCHHARGEYTLGEFIDGLEKAVKENETNAARSPEALKAIAFLSGSMITYVVQTVHDLRYDGDEISLNMKVDPVLMEDTKARQAKDVLANYQDYSMLRETEAADSLHAMALMLYGHEFTSQKRGWHALEKVFDDAAARHDTDPSGSPHFAAWLARCQAAVAKGERLDTGDLLSYDRYRAMHPGAALPDARPTDPALAPRTSAQAGGKGSSDKLDGGAGGGTSDGGKLVSTKVRVGTQEANITLPAGLARLDGIDPQVDVILGETYSHEGERLCLMAGTEEEAQRLIRKEPPVMDRMLHVSSIEVPWQSAPGAFKEIAAGVIGDMKKNKVLEKDGHLLRPAARRARITLDQSPVFSSSSNGVNSFHYSYVSREPAMLSDSDEERNVVTTSVSIKLPAHLLVIIASSTLDAAEDRQWVDKAAFHLRDEFMKALALPDK